jgi:hypothetical protein
LRERRDESEGSEVTEKILSVETRLGRHVTIAVNEKSWSIHVDNESIKDIPLEVVPGITKFLEYVTQEFTQPKIDSW